MKVAIALFSATLMLAGLSGAAEADGRARTRDPGVNARQHHQKHRIQQGVRSGELTRAETKDLRQDRRDIRQKEHEYKSDGKLTRAERRDLHQDMHQASRDIYKEKHDDERR